MSPHDREFELLLQRVRQGEEAAVTEFCRTFERHIRREVRMLLTEPRLRQVHSISDVCQSVLFSLLVRLAAGQYDLARPEDLLGLLQIMTENKVRQIARHERAQRRDIRRVSDRSEEELAQLENGKPSPSSVFANRDLMEKIVRELPPELRHIPERRAHGETWAELAAPLGLQADALRRRYERALDDLLERLDPETRDP